MSDPDDITKLKAIVQTYEKEWLDSGESFVESVKQAKKTNSNIQKTITEERLLNHYDLIGKLLVAYRDYVKVLEPYVPR